MFYVWLCRCGLPIDEWREGKEEDLREVAVSLRSALFT